MPHTFARHAPVVLDSVVEALTKVHWFKANLRSFLARAGVPAAFLAEHDWSQQGPYKRVIARSLVDRLAADPLSGTPILDRIIDALVEQETFEHLRKLEDGETKAREAREAVDALRTLLGRKSVVERAERARREQRTEAERAAAAARSHTEAIAALQRRFQALALLSDVQRRGLDLEGLLRDLFALHDLNPRGAFAIPGEQTDGSIVIDGTYILVEAKWKAAPTAPEAVRDFRSKVEDKLDSTLGLFLSMSGFTQEAVLRAAQGRRLLLLMDGQELALIFQGINDLCDVLRQKLRKASETGNVFFRPGLD